MQTLKMNLLLLTSLAVLAGLVLGVVGWNQADSQPAAYDLVATDSVRLEISVAVGLLGNVYPLQTDQGLWVIAMGSQKRKAFAFRAGTSVPSDSVSFPILPQDGRFFSIFPSENGTWYGPIFGLYETEPNRIWKVRDGEVSGKMSVQGHSYVYNFDLEDPSQDSASLKTLYQAVFPEPLHLGQRTIAPVSSLMPGPVRQKAGLPPVLLMTANNLASATTFEATALPLPQAYTEAYFPLTFYSPSLCKGPNGSIYMGLPGSATVFRLDARPGKSFGLIDSATVGLKLANPIRVPYQDYFSYMQADFGYQMKAYELGKYADVAFDGLKGWLFRVVVKPTPPGEPRGVMLVAHDLRTQAEQHWELPPNEWYLGFWEGKHYFYYKDPSEDGSRVDYWIKSYELKPKAKK